MALYPCVLGRLRNGDFFAVKWRTSCRVCLLLWDANVPWYLVAITCASKKIHVSCVAGVIVHIRGISVCLAITECRFFSCLELRYFVFGFIRCFGMRGCFFKTQQLISQNAAPATSVCLAHCVAVSKSVLYITYVWPSKGPS